MRFSLIGSLFVILAGLQAIAYSPKVEVDARLNSYTTVLNNETVRSQLVSLYEQGYSFADIRIVALGKCMAPLFIFDVSASKSVEDKVTKCSFSVTVGSCGGFGDPNFDPTKLEVKEVGSLDSLKCE
jgi:hypothetical protein